MGVRFGDDVASWTKFFLEGVIETAAKGTDALNDIMNLQREYEEEVKGMGSRSANALKIIDTMYKNPFIDITKASLVIGQSFPTARTLIEEMARRNILQEITGSKRGKKYVLSKYINIFMK